MPATSPTGLVERQPGIVTGRVATIACSLHPAAPFLSIPAKSGAHPTDGALKGSASLLNTQPNCRLLCGVNSFHCGSVCVTAFSLTPYTC